MNKAIPFMLHQPKFWQTYSKMCVYSVCINLQTDFVGVASSLQRYVYKPPEGQTKRPRSSTVDGLAFWRVFNVFCGKTIANIAWSSD